MTEGIHRIPPRIWLLWCHDCGAWLDEDSTQVGAYQLVQEHPGCEDHRTEAIRYDRLRTFP